MAEVNYNMQINDKYTMPKWHVPLLIKPVS